MTPTGDVTRQALGGYAAGGQDASVKFDQIDKLAFPSDTKTTLVAVLTSGRGYLKGFADCGEF